MSPDEELVTLHAMCKTAHQLLHQWYAYTPVLKSKKSIFLGLLPKIIPISWKALFRVLLSQFAWFYVHFHKLGSDQPLAGGRGMNSSGGDQFGIGKNLAYTGPHPTI